MEKSEEEWTEQKYVLYKERRLALYKMPTEELTRLIHGLEKYKSQCKEIIQTLKIVLGRKKQVFLQEDHSHFYDRKYRQNVDQSKDFEEGNRFQNLLSLVQRLNKNDLCDGAYILDKPYSTDEEEEEKRRVNKQNAFAKKNLMQKDLRQFTDLLYYLYKMSRLKALKMPIKDFRRFLEGLKKYKSQHTECIDHLQFIFTLKIERLKLSSEEESQKNKQYLKRMRQQKPAHKNQKLALQWKRQIEIYLRLADIHFEDGFYAQGDILDQNQYLKYVLSFDLKETKRKTEQNISQYSMTFNVLTIQVNLIKDSLYELLAKSKLEEMFDKETIQVSSFKMDPKIEVVSDTTVRRKIYLFVQGKKSAYLSSKEDSRESTQIAKKDRLKTSHERKDFEKTESKKGSSVFSGIGRWKSKMLKLFKASPESEKIEKQKGGDDLQRDGKKQKKNGSSLPQLEDDLNQPLLD